MESDNLKAFAAKVRRSWAASKPKRDAAAQRLRQSAEEFSVIVADSASAAAASAKRSWAEGAPARAEAAAQLRRTAARRSWRWSAARSSSQERRRRRATRGARRGTLYRYGRASRGGPPAPRRQRPSSDYASARAETAAAVAKSEVLTTR